VIYESPGWISDLRVHPDGERVLIADCPGRGDNAAFVRIVHRDGTVEDLGFGGSWGVLWAPDGETVWCSTGSRLLRMRRGEEREMITGTPNGLRLLDVSPTGGVLVASAMIRREMIVHAPGEENERDFGWQDWTTPRLLSDDGRWAVFEEGNDAQRDGYAVYLRNTDGSPPLLLGYGTALALSPDGSRLAMLKRPFSDDRSLALVPTGPGEPRPVDLRGLNVASAQSFWLAAGDGHGESLVVLARRGDEPFRIYRFWLDGTDPQAITPTDFALAPAGHRVSPDGRRLIVKPASGPAVAFGIAGDGPHALAGVLPTDNPVNTDATGRRLYVQAGLTLPSPVYLVDTVSGERTLWREIAPRDPAGVFVVDRLRITPDGSAYAYSLRRQVSRLLFMEGLR
jgi:hypothetical protein